MIHSTQRYSKVYPPHPQSLRPQHASSIHKNYPFCSVILRSMTNPFSLKHISAPVAKWLPFSTEQNSFNSVRSIVQNNVTPRNDPTHPSISFQSRSISLRSSACFMGHSIRKESFILLNHNTYALTARTDLSAQEVKLRLPLCVVGGGGNADDDAAWVHTRFDIFL